MAESSYVGGYWRARPEPLDACAARFADLLATLASLDPAFGSWYAQGGSRSSAGAPLDVSAAGLATVLAAGTARRDSDRSVMTTLGWSAGMWNGRDDAGVSLRVRCGGSSERVNNNVVVDLPDPAQSPAAAALYTAAVAGGIVEAVVASWDPDWATFTSNRVRSAQGAPVGTPVVGWATYLRGRDVVTLGDDPGSVDLTDVERTRAELLGA